MKLSSYTDALGNVIECTAEVATAIKQVFAARRAKKAKDDAIKHGYPHLIAQLQGQIETAQALHKKVRPLREELSTITHERLRQELRAGK